MPKKYMRPERRGIEKRFSNSGPSLKFRINEYKEVLGRWKKEYYVEVGMAVTYYLQVCLSSASELSPIDWQAISANLSSSLSLRFIRWHASCYAFSESQENSSNHSARTNGWRKEIAMRENVVEATALAVMLIVIATLVESGLLDSVLH